MKKLDDQFYNRADQYIDLANAQLKDAKRGEVGTSMMYGAARFSTWVSACNFKNGEDMKAKKQEMTAHLTEQFKLMLEENLEDYFENFDTYMK